MFSDALAPEALDPVDAPEPVLDAGETEDGTPGSADAIWQGLEHLLRHILGGIEQLHWRIEALSDGGHAAPAPVAPPLADQEEWRDWQRAQFSSLQAGLRDLTSMTDALVDSALDVAAAEPETSPAPMADPAALSDIAANLDRFAMGAMAELTSMNVKLSRLTAAIATPRPDPAANLASLLAAMEARLSDQIATHAATLSARVEDLQTARPEPASDQAMPAWAAPLFARLGRTIAAIDRRLHLVPTAIDLMAQESPRLSPWDMSAGVEDLRTRLGALDRKLAQIIRAQESGEPTSMPQMRSLLAEILAFQQREESRAAAE